MALGEHILLEFYGVNNDVLNDAQTLESTLKKSAEKANATIVNSNFHTFSPYGVTGVIVVMESHFSIHTWPEHNYAAIDIFTCSDKMNYKAAIDYLVQNLQPKTFETKIVERGKNALKIE